MIDPGLEQSRLNERYRLIEPLGDGGQGRTYRAEERGSGQQLALKVIELRGGSWKALDLFERESQVLRSLEHPGIPRYLDTLMLEEEGRLALAMELVEGPSLRQLMQEQRPLAADQLEELLLQALDILEYLHSLAPPVIHRDVKPANLILSSGGALHLVDFGGVRVALRPEGGSTVVGTFGYMAPEQFHGEALPATDIFGLGATLAALASGTEADKLPRQGLRIDLDHVMAPSPLRELLGQMLAPDPGDRLGSVAQVRQALREARTAAASSQSAPPATSPGGDANQPAPEEDPLHLLLRLVGMLGYVGLVLVETVLLPVIFALLSSSWSRQPRRLNQLRSRERQIRGAVGSSKRALKQLADGRRDGDRRDDPPLLPPPRPPRGKRRGRGGRRRLR